MADGVFQDIESSAFQSHAIKQNRREDHPSYGKQPERSSVRYRTENHIQRHPIHSDREHDSGGQTRKRGHPRRLSQDAYQQKQYGNRYGGDYRRQEKAIRDRGIVLLPHGAEQYHNRASGGVTKIKCDAFSMGFSNRTWDET